MTTLSLIHPKLNRELKVFFKPKFPTDPSKRYMPTGVYRLPDYIGYKNASKFIELALSDTNDKFVKKYRKYGAVIAYKK